MSRFNIPDWLETWRISDSLRQEAYESADSKARALLKTALALAAFHNQPAPSITYSSAIDERLGFWQASSSRPVDWALIVFDSSYAAAARLCMAAAMPALADVGNILAICVQAKPTPAALVALEMAGIGDLYQTSQSQLERFLIDNAETAGCVLLLHEGQLNGICATCARLRITFYEEACPPLLFIETPEAFNPDLMIFAQGFLPPQTRPKAPLLDAIYTANRAIDARPAGARLVLGPGCEGYWTFPGLDKNFFTISSQANGLLEGNDDGL